MTKDDMTLEKLAQMVQRGFEQTASKTDLGAVRAEVKDVKHAVDGLDMRLSSYASYWRDELEAIKERVEALEKTPRH